MTRALSVVLQFILYLVVFAAYLVVFAAGSLLPALNKLPMLSVSAGVGRVFVYDGLLLMLVAYILILLVSYILIRLVGIDRKYNRIVWLNSTIALFLALILGLAMKFGFKSV